jgi:hypothetical protein
MAQTDLYLGRGIVTLGGTDAGNVRSLTVRHDIEQFRRQPFETNVFRGGAVQVVELVQAVRVEMVFYEYQSATLTKLLSLSGGGFFAATHATYSLSYAGFNRMDECAEVTFSAPVFVPDRPDIALITDGLGEITVTGEILRTVGGSPEWYSLVLN